MANRPLTAKLADSDGPGDKTRAKKKEKKKRLKFFTNTISFSLSGNYPREQWQQIDNLKVL